MSRAADRWEFPDALPATDGPPVPSHASPSFESLADALTQIVWISRPDGAVAWFNRRWYEFSGKVPGDTRNARDVWHPDDVAAALLEWERVRDAGLPFEKEYRFRRADGVYRWFLARAVPIRDERGIITHWVGIATDITERREAEQARDDESRHLSMALDAGQIGTWDLDLVIGVALVSERAAEIFGLPAGCLQMTREVWRACLHREDRDRAIMAFEAAAAGRGEYEIEYRIQNTSDEAARWIASRGTFLRDDNGRAVRALGVLRDVTDEKRAAETLRATAESLGDTEERLRLATESAGVGIWDFYPLTGEAVIDERCRRMFGQSIDHPMRFADFLAVIHEDDQERVRAAVERAFDPAHEGEPYAIAFRAVCREEGALRWLRANGRALFRGGGAGEGARVAWRFIGTLLDVTERRQAIDALRAERERLSLALTAAGMTPWEWDMRADRFAARPSAAVRAESTLDALLQLVHPDDRERVAAALRATSETGAPYEEETRGLPADGQYRWYLGRGRAIRGATGEVEKVVGVTLDITERREGERRRRFLDSLSDRIRPLLDPETVLAEAARSLGEFLGVSRCAYSEVDRVAGTITARRDYTNGVPSWLGTARLDDFGSEIIDPLRAGEPVMSSDVRTDPRLSPRHRINYSADELPALLVVPLLKEGELVAVLAVHQNTPRVWTEEEVRLIGIVAERTWLAVENARLYRAARREEERFRALVQASSHMVWTNNAEGMAEDMPQWRAYTGQTSDAIRGYGWMEALHPDDRARTTEVWRRAFAARDVYECDYRIRGRDGEYRWFVSRAVPLLNEDGSLREYVGMSTNVDAERRAEEKQRRIAETLQRSMLFTPPEGVFPGLRVVMRYEPAWDEAQVGGDFHDAFALAEGRVALVVGDVTGKGLEAAAYTAEVKYALRAFLREDTDPGTALSRLNRFLLDGQRYDQRSVGALVCLSLAVVDPATGAARFAVAGSEPPLIVRASDRRMDAVQTGGLPLGTDLGDTAASRMPDYEAEAIHLAPGDLLVMTTDGVTEARAPGARAAFFGIEGVAAVVTGVGADPRVPVRTVADAVLGGAKAFANGGGLNDDVCLLVARRTGGMGGVMEGERHG